MMRWAYLTAIVGIIATLIADIWVDVDYRLAANVSLIYVALFTTAFALLYGVRSKWWTNRIGKIFLAKSVVLPLVIAQAALATWWDTEYPFRQQIRFIVYSLGAVVYVPMLVSLWREQQRDRRKARGGAP